MPTLRALRGGDPLTRPRLWPTIAIFTVVFLVVLNLSITEVAIPTIRVELGASIEGVQWVINGYSLPFSALLLFGTRLGSKLGVKRVLLAAAFIFGAGSLVCLIAPGLPALIAGRAIQGTAASVIVPLSLALIDRLYPDAGEKIRALAAWSVLNGLANVAGPVLGGLITEHANWHYIFAPTIPLLTASIIIVWRCLEGEKGSGGSLDPLGAIYSVGWVGLFAYAVSAAPTQGWSNGMILTLIAAAVLISGIFFVHERRRGDSALLPLRMFREESYAVASVSAFVIGLVPVPVFVLLMLYFQQVLGWDAVRSGLAFLPVAIGVTAAGPLAGRLTGKAGKAGNWVVLSCGLAVTAAAVGALALPMPYPALSVVLLAFGVGTGLALTAVNGGAMEGVTDPAAGAAGVNTSLEVGGVLGVAMLGAILNGRYLSALGAGLHQLGVTGREAAAITPVLRGGPLIGHHTAESGPELRHAVTQAAVNAYTSGIRLADLVGACVLALAVVIVATMRARRPVQPNQEHGPDTLSEVSPARFDG
jgi:MFS transporter, DHA2 family, methylenomycin A resistance protein